MRPDSLPVNGASWQRGSMLVMALFVIVVLSLLGLTMVNMLSATSGSVVVEVLGARALNAADSGLERMAAQAFAINSPPQSCDATLASDNTFGEIPGLRNCQYTARCTTTEIEKDGLPHWYYRLSSTGVCQGGDIWVSRTVSMDALQEQP